MPRFVDKIASYQIVGRREVTYIRAGILSSIMRRHFFIGFAIVVLTLMVFAPVLNHGFIGEWDDRVNVKENPYLNPVTLPKLLHFWRGEYQGLYIPVTYSSWAAIAKLSQTVGSERSGELGPGAFHLANLLLHAISGLLVFAILRVLIKKDWPAGAGALLFALHPLQVEPVAWITGMKDVLAGMMSLVAVWQYLCFAQSPNEPSATIKRKAHYAASSVAFVLALLSKPGAVIVPLVNCFLDYWMLRRPWKQSVVAHLPWIAIAIPIIVITKLAQPDDPSSVLPHWARPLIAADSLSFYLYKLFFPLWIGPDYGRLPQFVLRHWWSYLLWVVPCGLAFCVWSMRKKLPWLGAAAGIFIIGLLPVSGLVEFDFQAISTVADRYLYFSMLGAALALAGLMTQLERWKIAWWGCLLLIVLLMLKTMLQIPKWRDTVTLFSHALTLNPNSWIAHNNLGVKRAGDGAINEALAHFRQAEQANHSYGLTYNNLGNILAMTGKLDDAITAYHRALKLTPGLAEAHNNLGLVLAKRGAIKEAMEHYRSAVKLQPFYAEAYNNLGNVLLEGGEADEAIHQYRRAIEINPDLVLAHFNLGNALVGRGQLPEAIQEFQHTLRLDPDFTGARNNLAAALLAQGKVDEAIEHFRKISRSRPEQNENRLNLANALLQQGQVDEAIKEFREALRIQPDLAPAHLNLARALVAQGKKAEAVKHYQEALRLMKSPSANTGRGQ